MHFAKCALVSILLVISVLALPVPQFPPLGLKSDSLEARTVESISAEPSQHVCIKGYDAAKPRPPEVNMSPGKGSKDDAWERNSWIEVDRPAGYTKGRFFIQIPYGTILSEGRQIYYQCGHGVSYGTQFHEEWHKPDSDLKLNESDPVAPSRSWLNKFRSRFRGKGKAT